MKNILRIIAIALAVGAIGQSVFSITMVKKALAATPGGGSPTI
jgi:hypothetical protein